MISGRPLGAPGGVRFLRVKTPEAGRSLFRAKKTVCCSPDPAGSGRELSFEKRDERTLEGEGTRAG